MTSVYKNLLSVFSSYYHNMTKIELKRMASVNNKQKSPSDFPSKGLFSSNVYRKILFANQLQNGRSLPVSNLNEI